MSQILDFLESVPAITLFWVLCGITVLSALRLTFQHIKALKAQTPRTFRYLILLIAQPLLAFVLYQVLQPQLTVSSEQQMVVLTSDIPLLSPKQNTRYIALPEVKAVPDYAVKTPDLGTALRRYSSIKQLLIMGKGLSPRDQTVDLSAYSVSAELLPLPKGLIELHFPERLVAGERFTVAGQVNGVSEGAVQLLDPSGEKVSFMELVASSQNTDSQQDNSQQDNSQRNISPKTTSSQTSDVEQANSQKTRSQKESSQQAENLPSPFELQGISKIEGLTEFTLQVLDKQQKVVEEAWIPLNTVASVPLNVLLMADSPSGEIKYLRRWLVDAGISLQTQINTGGGVGLSERPMAMTVENLKKQDVLIIDERVLGGFSNPQAAALQQAVQQGLGLMVRVTGNIPARTQQRLQSMGITIKAATDTQPLVWKIHPLSDSKEKLIPELTQLSIQSNSSDMVAFFHNEKNIGYWKNVGQGRVGVFGIQDSFRLTLMGYAGDYGQLWSEMLGHIGRSSEHATADIAAINWMNQRSVICGIGQGSFVVSPRVNSFNNEPETGLASDDSQKLMNQDSSNNNKIILINDSDRPDCAGYWAMESGWHQLVQMSADNVPAVQPFYIYTEQQLQGISQFNRQLATQQKSVIANENQNIASVHKNIPLWIWVTIFILLAGFVWWFERVKKSVGRE